MYNYKINQINKIILIRKYKYLKFSHKVYDGLFNPKHNQYEHNLKFNKI
jgi:hypothetical protein